MDKYLTDQELVQRTLAENYLHLRNLFAATNRRSLALSSAFCGTKKKQKILSRKVLSNVTKTLINTIRGGPLHPGSTE